MVNLLTEYLVNLYDEVEPKDFYRVIFPEGELQAKGVYGDGKLNAICVEVTKEKTDIGKYKVLRHTITDDLSKLDEIIERDNFCLMSPIGYIGKERKADNARILYAIAVDLDGIIINGDDLYGMRALFHQIDGINRIPRPTYIVSSGTGLHLYYVFKKPIRLYANAVRQLQKYKKELTRIIWQGYITSLEKNVQYESLFQGFRVVGTITKKGERARAFEIGDRVTMEYMNSFVSEEFQTSKLDYTSKYKLDEAKEKFPEWYEKRIVQKKPRGTWECKRALYDWWIRKIKEGAKVGHRYYCLMMLAIYARKSGITREELEKDAFELMEFLDNIEAPEDNRFTEKDVIDSLQAFDDRFITYPINSIKKLSDIRIDKNKRNYRKQEAHLYLARRKKKDMKVIGEVVKEGRPTAERTVREWQESHPAGKKADCIRETGLAKHTVYKWWN